MQYPSFMRSLFFCLALLCAAAGAQASDLDKTLQFEIPAQQLSPALIQFSGQTNLQIITRAGDVSQLKTRGVTGRMSVEAALKKLLEGTGVSYVSVGEGTIEISTRPVAEKIAPVAETRGGGYSGQLLLAQTEQTGRAGSAVQEAADETEMKGVPELLVRGQRSINADIERTRDDPQPYVVFGKDDIRRSQSTTLEDFLRTRLPQNSSPNGLGQQIGAALPYSNINLRGLGSNQTLILVDGRRLASVGNTGNFIQPDINGIALSSIERIEVLPSTAGGIYGGGATGGVINIVMRHDFSGAEIKADYNNTFDTDTGNTRVEANGGFSLEGGKTQVMLSASYSEGHRLLTGDRDFSARGLALQARNNPAMFTQYGAVPLGYLTNIQSLDGSDLTIKPEFGGGALGSSFTHLPLGYTGPLSDNGAGLIANAGSFDYRLPNDQFGAQEGMLAAPSVQSATAHIRRGFGERLEAFVDLSSLESRRKSFGTSVIFNDVLLSADAPTNYFDQDVEVRIPTPNLRFPIRGKSTTVRATGGLLLRMAGNWTAEADYSWSRSRFGSAAFGAPLNAKANLSLGSGLSVGGLPALNALQEPNTHPIDYTPYLLPGPNRFNGPNSTILKDATLRTSGPVLTLPGGKLTLSALAERRDEGSEVAFLENLNSTTLLKRFTYFPERSQSIDSLYVEARAPVLRNLELQASARHDRYTLHSDGSFGYPVPSRDGPFPDLHYSTSKLSSTDYTFGIRYSPLEDVTLRASIGTGFLPPNITQISPVTGEIDYEYGPDPLRGNTDIYNNVPIETVSGGSSRLRPEESKSFSAGIILTPRVLPALRLSVDYTRINKTDEIQYADSFLYYILAHPDLFPGRATRGPNLDGDQPGWAGPITALDLTFINLAKSRVEAYDIQADYTVRSERGLGDFHWFALATYEPHLANQFVPEDGWLEHSGYSDGQLKWQGNIGLTWDRGPLSVGWNMQYYHSYLVYSSYVLSDPQYVADAIQSQGSDHIPRQMYHDLIVTYRLGAGLMPAWLQQTELSVGVQNVLNTSPPIIAITDSSYEPGYSTYGDPRMRRYSVSFRKSF